MSSLFGFAITVVPRVYTYYLREDYLEFMHNQKSHPCNRSIDFHWGHFIYVSLI